MRICTADVLDVIRNFVFVFAIVSSSFKQQHILCLTYSMSFQFAVYISSKLYYITHQIMLISYYNLCLTFSLFFTATAGDAISTDVHSRKFNVYCVQFASPFYSISHVECGTEKSCVVFSGFLWRSHWEWYSVWEEI